MKRISELSPKQLDALTQFRRETIMFPQFENAYRSISESLTLYRQTGLVDCMALYGETGCGKTTVCKVIEGENQRYSEPHRDVVPVLYASIPALATISSVAECLLTKIGDPAPSKGTNSSKTERLIGLIQACAVDMVILDELQHVHDRGQSPTIYKVGDWIKNFADRIAKPVVLVGIRRAEILVATNGQLRRRFSAGLPMDRMTLDNETSTQEFTALVSTLFEALPIQCVLRPSSYETLEQLYYATDGRIGYLVSLFQRALMLAFCSDSTKISEAILEQAFVEQIWEAGHRQLNPFNKDFCRRRLDKRLEPFAAESIGVKAKMRHQSETRPI
ncbi:TniB family NTP-binding protein [Burkholderia sp. BCC1998]|uniref:TniB family NTP-binding protein n=1 Tax=Burkholderia sp. BCC1998 TaxID=2817447 RepID=UPI002AB6DACB|nr:TniB family NTP-binding protein [Burkholderia sp. BCC1998]